MKVFKFGGASVKDADSIRNVAGILKKYASEPLVVVLSAMGKMTNAFEHLAEAAYHNDTKRTLGTRTEIQSYHFGILHQLFDDNHPVYRYVNDLFDEIDLLLRQPVDSRYDAFYDSLIPFGELLSTRILSCYLDHSQVKHYLADARAFIRTGSQFREAVVDWAATTNLVGLHIGPMVQENQPFLVLTQGFIGADGNGHTTTLGREGSDYTAAIMAYCLGAEEVTIWKDVPGLLNADPKRMPGTIVLDHISYREAIELAYYGATVIHPKTIQPLENKKIPLRVRYFFDPDVWGTLIDQHGPAGLPVPCYIFKPNQALLSISPRDFSFMNTDNLSEVFRTLSEFRIKINLMQNSAISFSVCFDYQPDNFVKLTNALAERFSVRYNTGLELITIRHYEGANPGIATGNRPVLLEQRSRTTLQLLVEGPTV